MKFQKIILTMATLLITGSAVAAGFDSRNNPVFTPGSPEEVQIKADLPEGTSALQFTVTLPESFELISEFPILNSRLTSKSHKEGNGVYNYVLYTEDNSAIVAASDWLFGLSLKAKASAGKGMYALKFTNIIVAATSGSETRIADCEVDLTVKIPVSQVKVLPSTLDLRAGDSAILKAEVTPADATDSNVTWTSSDSNIATVDADGTVTAMKSGSATIMATTSDGTNLSATCKVNVMPPLATGVTLNQSELNLTVKETFTLTASVIPGDAEQQVNWSTSDAKIVTVDANGKVSALASGTAVIRAIATDGSGVSGACTVTVADAKVSSIILSKTALGLRIGNSETITATVFPEYAANRDIIWSSSNPVVATVDTDGKVTAVSLGDAVITASAADGSGVTATSAVTVTNALATGISIDRSTVTLFVDQSLKLTATVTPEGAVGSVNWSSDMPDVATVDKDGNVSAIIPGRAVITATTADGTNLTASCMVIVEPVKAESVTLSVPSWTGKVGEGFTLTATVLPENTTDKTITWSSSNVEVATVDANGYVVTLSLGNAVITASCGNVSAKCDVTVVATPVESLTVSPESWAGIEGENFTIIATVLPEDATDKSLSWSSSDPDIAAVDQEGNVLVLKDGSCVIRVVTLDGSNLSAECIVTSRSGINEIFANPDVMVDIYSISGKLLNHRCTFDYVNQLSPGLYIIICGGVSKTVLLNQ